VLVANETEGSVEVEGLLDDDAMVMNGVGCECKCGLEGKEEKGPC
jgi:hypothetical protein